LLLLATSSGIYTGYCYQPDPALRELASLKQPSAYFRVGLITKRSLIGLNTATGSKQRTATA
jgi:hypothetical protein